MIFRKQDNIRRVNVENGLCVYDGLFTEKLLDQFREYLIFHDEQGTSFIRNSPEIQDTAIDIKRNILTDRETSDMPSDESFYSFIGQGSQFVSEFFTEFWGPVYSKEIPSLRNIAPHGILNYKVQRNKPGQAYNIWHVEHAGLESRSRLAAFILYLNDVEEGGETEFQNQKIRVEPKKNRLIVFPSNYTMCHRGLPPLGISDDKFILTGWIEFTGL